MNAESMPSALVGGARLMPDEPVLLVHLADSIGLAMCCGRPFNPPGDAHPLVPRVLCTGCWINANHAEPAARTHHMGQRNDRGRWLANCSCGDWHPEPFEMRSSALMMHRHHEQDVTWAEQFAANDATWGTFTTSDHAEEATS
jgi:hypothetical protein